MRTFLLALLATLFALSAAPADSWAQAPKAKKAAKTDKSRSKSKKKSGTKKSGAKKSGKSKVTIPLDVGVGPALNHFFGPIGDDQMFHYGIKLDVAAIINKQVIEQNLDKVPSKYRNMAKKIDEMKIYPLWWLPDSLIISPKVENTAMYGITFRPLHLGMNLFRAGPVNLSVSAGAVLTYAYISNDKWVNGDSMHFLRPGADARAELGIMFSQNVGISLGWSSAFYVPQAVDQKDSGMFDVPGIENSIWHNGQAFLLFHYRFPYSTSF